MKKLVFILFAFAVQMSLFAQEYFPEGTKWTEIRLDTLKYDSWYSKVGDEWVPNFETIEYHVQGEFIDERTNDKYSCVYTNGQERTDSLTLLLYNHRIGNNDAGWYGEVTVAAFDNNGQLLWPFYGQMYPLSYEVGTSMSSLNILIAGATGGGWPWEWDEYGTVEEIKEGDFGGVRPLKYSDVNGIRFIQGIGVASWNDGECIFGPIRPYEVLSHLRAVGSDNRHYRSMLVHFERDGEVLYDVWPRKGSTVEVAIDGLNYFLYLDRHEAVLTSRNNCSGEVDIPSEVRYNDETFVVKSMTHTAFHNNSELTKVRIPKTIEEIIHYYPVDPDWLDPPTGMANPIYVNPFKGCTALESIEVDEENPCMKSIDGVLFSQDGVGQYYYKTGSYSGTGLYCYPEGVRQESYTIPESVEWIGGAAFPNNQYLTTLTIPNSMKHICYDAFSGCCNLTDVYCYAENVPIAWDGAFRNVPIASATLHVPVSSIDKYKAASSWNEFGNIVATGSSVTFTKDQMATIILPTEPEASKGKYYRLDRVEGNEIIFEQELQPRAHVPYIIVPGEDFSIEVDAMELEGLRCDTASVEGISFIGTYQKEEVESQEGFYIKLIDTTPDCSLSPSGEAGRDVYTIGTLRAYLLVHWNDPYSHGGTKTPAEKLEIVLHDDATGIESIQNSKFKVQNEDAAIYDVSGKPVNRKSLSRKSTHGIYIKDGKKVAFKQE